MIAYLDSSAFVKLVRREDESEALIEALRGWEHRASSMLMRVEVLRGARLAGERALVRADLMLRDVSLLPVSEAILEPAAELQPAAVRTLDAIHISSALALGDDLGVLVTYDHRMLEAAAEAGIETLAPV